MQFSSTWFDASMLSAVIRRTTLNALMAGVHVLDFAHVVAGSNATVMPWGDCAVCVW
jgi:hypothetical protein